MSSRTQFTEQLRRVSLRWRTRFDAELRAAGQTLTRANVLRFLARHPDGVTQRELAEHLMVEHPTLVRMLDALQEQGLIARRPIEGNRRANSLHLLPAALPMVAELEATFAAEAERVLGDIPPEELERATRLLRRIAEKLEDGS
ncbi:MarR family transcriptional regulator [Rhodovarius crocodyli]|uniref:MarR family transcriptional regulator n=1 Tax=Rhodovarius crocodyli TaxID=1979269 RepID=A0A437MPF0_9PROT|nr:MarR family transcriptional regulator [Rhodovarius crocodyli]RVT99509.1 MarR family transcriptional regulator [Rhodovarius crocodyli]